MDPEFERLARNLEKNLKRGETVKTYLASLDEVTELLVSLDAGMIDGAVVPKEKKDRLMASSLEFATRSFEQATRLDPKRAARWVTERPVYMRPKTIDFARWAQLAAGAKNSAQAAMIDPRAPEVPPGLSKAMLALLDLAHSYPSRNLLKPPAGESDIRGREEELGFALPAELRLLYRLCNGFSLFRQDQSADVDDSPFRFVTIENLKPFSWTVGDELPKRVQKRHVTDDDLMNDPARLQAFDVGNGDFVSCCTDGERTIWVDDYSDGPQRVLTRSLADLLQFASAPERMRGSKWSHGAWVGL